MPKQTQKKNQTQKNKQEELLDVIGKMTVLELAEFVEAFKERFNVTVPVAAPAAPGGVPGAGAAVAEEEREEQTEFEVVLEAVGERKIQVIKVVREVTNLGLKEAKELVDKAPSTVSEGVPREEAERIKAKLEEQGARAAIK